jgi:signal transduction histidine kinase
VLASLRGRLTLIFALSIAIFMALLCAGVVYYSDQLEPTHLAQSLEEHAHKCRLQLREAPRSPRTIEDWQAFINRENQTEHGFPLSMLVLDKAEKVVARSHNDGPSWPLNGDWIVETIQAESHTLVLAARWHSQEREIRELTKKLFLIALGVVLATATGSWLLVGRVLSPIDRLSQQARSASTEDLNVRLQSPSRDVEVVALVDMINALLESLSRTAESRGRFYAAASHELRTPIQGLSALLEVGLSRPRNSEQWNEIATEALGESRRLGALTQELLELNQLENQTVAPACSDIDAADVIERIVHQLRPQIEIRRLNLALDLPEDAEIYVPWNHLEMLFRNLIENAVKYATEDGQVKIRFHREVDSSHFSVWNSADLPANLDVDKLFEPFFRLDNARQSQTGGNGLGMALVASLCRANGWNVQLKNVDQGLLVRVEMSVVPAE